MASELLDLEVYRRNFRVGPPLTAHIDLDEEVSREQLDGLLRDAARRDGRGDLGDYHLRVLTRGGTIKIHKFVTTTPRDER